MNTNKPAQGVPDGWQLVPKKPTDEMLIAGTYRIEVSASYKAMLASAPPVPQPEDDSAASVNDTNAVLAGRYFELLKVVEQYEKSGVTCQTFRHFISEPCAECNSPGICGKQAKPQPLSDEFIQSMCKESWVFETVKQWVRIIESAHGIKE